MQALNARYLEHLPNNGSSYLCKCWRSFINGPVQDDNEHQYYVADAQTPHTAIECPVQIIYLAFLIPTENIEIIEYNKDIFVFTFNLMTMLFPNFPCIF